MRSAHPCCAAALAAIALPALFAAVSPPRPIEVEIRGDPAPAVVAAFDRAQRKPSWATWNRATGNAQFQSIANLWNCAASPAQGPTMFVFSEGHAATNVPAARICKELRDSKRVIVNLPPATPVTLFIWLRSPDLRPMIEDEIANTNWLYRSNHVGAVYKPVFIEDAKFARKGDLNIVQRGAHSAEFPDSDCRALQASNNLLETSGINVFVGVGPNLTCGATPDHPRKDIVFIQESPVLGVTAHEFGHAAGLDADADGDSNLSYKNGHVPPNATAEARFDPTLLFDVTNTLWPSNMILHDALSFGQIFWMNFSSQSYLAQNRTKQPDAVPNLICPTQCPSYALHLPEHPLVLRGATIHTATPGNCGSTATQACTPRTLSLMSRTVNRLRDTFGLTTRTAFDIQFELTQNLENVPHYCTQELAVEALTKRYEAVCVSGRFGKCGHANVDEFVQFWMKSITAAGMIEALTSKALQAATVAGKIDPKPKSSSDQWTYSAYAARAYDVARRGIDVSSAGHLLSVQGKKILWMDDPGNNRAEQDILRGVGIDIACSGQPGDAIRQIQDANSWLSRLRPGRRPISLVVAHFGKGAGVELFNRIQAEKLGLKVIIYSRGLTPEIRDKAKKMGIYDETDDPVELVEAVFRGLEGK